MLRAIIDRLIVAAAMLLGVDLPPEANTLVAVMLVCLAAGDAYMRRREGGLDKVLERAKALLEARESNGASVSQEMKQLRECIDCVREHDEL